MHLLFWLLLIALTGVQLGDVYSTWRVALSGGTDDRPIIALLITRLGLWPTMAIKAAVSLIGPIALFLLASPLAGVLLLVPLIALNIWHLARVRDFAPHVIGSELLPLSALLIAAAWFSIHAFH